MRSRARAAALALALLAAGCQDRFLPTAPQPRSCGGYDDPRQSPYLLPYPAGAAYLLLQGNCTRGSHSESFRYSYDFDLPLGSLVTAARDGVVAAVEDGSRDGVDVRPEQSNFVKVRHDDGTYGRYYHLLHGGALVRPGQRVRAGDPLALSGETGTDIVHLHFDVAVCEDNLCDTLPSDFRNASPLEPGALVEGVVYLALPPGAATASRLWVPAQTSTPTPPAAPLQTTAPPLPRRPLRLRRGDRRERR